MHMPHLSRGLKGLKGFRVWQCDDVQGRPCPSTVSQLRTALAHDLESLQCLTVHCECLCSRRLAVWLGAPGQQRVPLAGLPGRQDVQLPQQRGLHLHSRGLARHPQLRLGRPGAPQDRPHRCATRESSFIPMSQTHSSGPGSGIYGCICIAKDLHAICKNVLDAQGHLKTALIGVPDSACKNMAIRR